MENDGGGILKRFYPAFPQKAGEVEGEEPSSRSAEREIPYSKKSQEGRPNSPVDCLAVGDPRRGSPPNLPSGERGKGKVGISFKVDGCALRRGFIPNLPSDERGKLCAKL